MRTSPSGIGLSANRAAEAARMPLETSCLMPGMALTSARRHSRRRCSDCPCIFAQSVLVHSIAHWSSSSQATGSCIIKVSTAPGRTARRLTLPPARGRCFWYNAG